MLIEDKRQALFPVLLGAVAGVAAYLLLSFLTQPGSFFGGTLDFAFTFCYNSQVPEVLGAAAGILLWGLFGALAGVATQPFADGGRALVLRSLLHFAVMMLTVGLWAFLNFFNPDYPLAFFEGDLWYFLAPVALVYVLIWLGRWVGWYAEAEQIREKLGLSAGPSPLKWRETLPYAVFAGGLCLMLPLVLRLCDAPDVPVLSGLLYPYILLPIGGFCSALSLGKRQGFCPLYPLACMGFILLFIPLARLCSNMDDWPLVWIALVFTLAGNLLGAWMGWKKTKRRRDET